MHRGLTTTEAAERLGVDRATVKRWVVSGTLRASFTLGGHARIPEVEVKTLKGLLRASAKKKRVLVVDDEPAVLRAVARDFRRHPEVELVTANSAGEALVLFGVHPPDVMVVDLRLQDLQGEQVISAVRQHGARDDVRIFGMTCDLSGERGSRALHAGAERVLQKPLRPEVLLPMILGPGPADATPNPDA